MSDPIPSRVLAFSPRFPVSPLVPPPDCLAPVCVSVLLRAPLSFTHSSLFLHVSARVIHPCHPFAVGRLVLMSSLPVVRPSPDSPSTPSRGGSSVGPLALPPLSGTAAPSRTVNPLVSSGGSVARPSRVEGFVRPAAPALPPLQKSRDPSGSTGAVEFRPASSGSALPRGGDGIRESIEEVPPHNMTEALRTSASYQPRPGSYSAWGSCRPPDLLPQKTRGILDAGAELADDTTQWFATVLARSIPLPVERLRFRGFVTPERESPSRSYCRVTLCAPTSCVCVAFMRQVMWRRSASSLLVLRARAEEFRIKIPDVIPCDRTFAYNIGEVYYEYRMAEHLVGRFPGARRLFILSDVEELYVSPRPYAYSKARVALQNRGALLCAFMGSRCRLTTGRPSATAMGMTAASSGWRPSSKISLPGTFTSYGKLCGSPFRLSECTSCFRMH